MAPVQFVFSMSILSYQGYSLPNSACEAEEFAFRLI